MALLAILLLQFSYASQAQRKRFNYSSDKEFSYGPTAGVNLSNLDASSYGSSGYAFGYFAGGFFEYNIAGGLSSVAELKVSSFGGEKISSDLLFTPNSSFLGDVQGINLKMVGVELPVILKYRLTTYVPEMYISAGLSGMYIVKSQAKLDRIIDYGGIYSSTSTYVDVTAKVQNMQAAAVVGIGASFPIGSNSFTVNAAINFGLTDLSANNAVYNNDFRSKIFKLGVGYIF